MSIGKFCISCAVARVIIFYSLLYTLFHVTNFFSSRYFDFLIAHFRITLIRGLSLTV